MDWGPVLEPYLDVFDACEAWLDECAKGLLRTVIPLPLHKQMQLRGVSTDTLNRGDARFAAVRATLSEFRDNDGDLLERSDTQIMFHQQMLNAAIQVRNLFSIFFLGGGRKRTGKMCCEVGIRSLGPK